MVFWNLNSGVEGGLAIDEVLAKSLDELVVSLAFWAVIADLLPVFNHGLLVSLELIKSSGVNKTVNGIFLSRAFVGELSAEEFVESLEGKFLVDDLGGISKLGRVFSVAIF